MQRRTIRTVLSAAAGDAAVRALLVATAVLSCAFGLPPPVLHSPVRLSLPSPKGILGMADEARRMTVPVMVNGRGPFPFVVDTGADRTVIAKELADTLGLNSAEPVVLHSTGGDDLTPTVHIDDLIVGARTISAISAPTLSASNLGAMGMLGIDSLRDQRVTMDFDREVMSVEPSRRERYSSDVVVVHARSRYGQLILVDASIRGRPIYVILDSGAQNSIGNSALRRLIGYSGLGMVHPVGQVVSVTGETTPADFALLPLVKVGGFSLHNLPVAFADLNTFRQFGLTDEPAMLLGMDTLRIFERVTVDFGRKDVSFEMPLQPPSAFVKVAAAR